MEKLKSLRLKLTPQRIAILKYLDINQDHPSAEKIFKVLKKNPTPHHLFREKCNKIFDIHCEISIPVSKLEKEGFQIMRSHIEFFGICPNCKTKRNK